MPEEAESLTVKIEHTERTTSLIDLQEASSPESPALTLTDIEPPCLTEPLNGKGGETEKRPFLQPDRFIEKMKALLAMADPSSSSFDWRRLTEDIAHETRADIALFLGYREDPQEWFLLGSAGMPATFGQQAALSRGWQSMPILIAQAEGRFLFSQDISEDRRFVGQMIRGTAVRTFSGTTLDPDGRCFGALIIGFSAPNAITKEENALFLSCSKQIGSFLPVFAPPGAIQIRPASLIEPEDNNKAVIKKTPPEPAPAPSPPPTPVPQASRRQPQASRPHPAPSHSEEISDREEDARLKNIGEALMTALLSVFQGEDFYREVLRKIVFTVEADIGYLFQWDAMNQRLFPVASHGVPQEMTRRIGQAGFRPDPLWLRVLDKGPSLLLPFENWKPPFKKRLCKEENFKSQVAVSITRAGTSWGLLSLFYRSHTVSPKELKLLEYVGERIGWVVDAVAQWQQVLKKIEQVGVVQKVCRDATYGTAGLTQMLDRIKEFLRASNAYLLRVDKTRNFLVGCAASTHAPRAIFNLSLSMNEKSLAASVAQKNQPLVIEHAPLDDRMDKEWLELFWPRALLAVPLCWQEQVIGVLILDETAYSRRFTEDEIESVVGVSHPAATALMTAIQYQEARERQETQEMLSLSALRMQEESRRALARRLEQETEVLLETARKGVREAAHAVSAWVPEESPVREQLTENNALLEKVTLNLKALHADLQVQGLEQQGLLAAVRAHVQTFSTLTGIPVTLNLPSFIKRSEPRFELMLYRILQEALYNIRKHAGTCSVMLAIESKDFFIQLSVTDTGSGFDARRYFSLSPQKRKGTGISEMKARADLLGGTFFIESTPGEGTRVSVKIPIIKREGL